MGRVLFPDRSGFFSIGHGPARANQLALGTAGYGGPGCALARREGAASVGYGHQSRGCFLIFSFLLLYPACRALPAFHPA